MHRFACDTLLKRVCVCVCVCVLLLEMFERNMCGKSTDVVDGCNIGQSTRGFARFRVCVCLIIVYASFIQNIDVCVRIACVLVCVCACVLWCMYVQTTCN